MNAYKLKPKSGRNPVYQRGYEAGRDEALDIFHSFLSNRMQTITDIPGIGEKTAWKIQEHFLQGMDNWEGK